MGFPLGQAGLLSNGERPSVVITFQGMGFHNLSWLEASEVTGLWGESHCNSHHGEDIATE